MVHLQICEFSVNRYISYKYRVLSRPKELVYDLIAERKDKPYTIVRIHYYISHKSL